MTSFKINQQNIHNLIEISKEAGEVILEIYKTNFDIQIKKDSSPLTQADLASHQIITSGLKKLTPNIPILSEESCNISQRERAKWKEYWLIDPLDGTKEFIKKNGEFTTNIAYIKKNKPMFGMIFAPVLNELYWGSEENGSYILKGESQRKPEKIQVSNKKKGNLSIVSSRSHQSSELKAFLKKLNKCKFIHIGSSLKFCLVAKGDAEIYPRLGPTSEWDTAAGDAIIRGANGIIRDTLGGELKYNMREKFINPSFIVANNLETFQKVNSNKSL